MNPDVALAIVIVALAVELAALGFVIGLVVADRWPS